MLVAVPRGVAGGLAYTGWRMKDSAAIYSRWLDRR
jgi:hypothetical protein